MLYDKLPYTYKEQASKLISKGLKVTEPELIDRLKHVSYFRLNAYLIPYKDINGNFVENASLKQSWSNYTFDRQLRLLVLDGIERVEVALRSQLLHKFSLLYGTFGYLDESNLPDINNYYTDGYTRWIKSLNDEVKRSKEDFIKHFKNKYGDKHDLPPIWVLAEIISYGNMLRLFNGVDSSIRKDIAKDYNVSDKVLASWLKTLGAVRNICAHHGRLFNRRLGVKPLIPKKNKAPNWHTPFTTDNSKIFSIILILKYLLDIVAPTSSWKDRYSKLINNSNIPTNWMGKPNNWQEHNIWNS